MEYGGTNGSPDIGPDWLGPNLSGTLTCALFQISFQQNMGEPTSSSPTESFLVPQSSYMTFELCYRYPPNGVWGNQRVPGRPDKVLEGRGRGFPGVAQASGSANVIKSIHWISLENACFILTKFPYQLVLKLLQQWWSISTPRQSTSRRRIWDKGDLNCTLIFLGSRGRFANWTLTDVSAVEYSTLSRFLWHHRIRLANWKANKLLILLNFAMHTIFLAGLMMNWGDFHFSSTWSCICLYSADYIIFREGIENYSTPS